MGAFPSFSTDPSTYPCTHLATLASSLSSLLPSILSSIHPSISSVKMSFHLSIIHVFCQSFLPSLLPAIIPPLYSSHVSSSSSIKDSFPHLWSGIITTLLCFNNPLKYCTQRVLAPLESSAPAHLGSQTPACSSSMVEKSGSSGLQGPPLLLVGESAVLESKGWTHGLGSEPVGKEGQGVRAEL